jgi:REase_DpnII-MboI
MIPSLGTNLATDIQLGSGLRQGGKAGTAFRGRLTRDTSLRGRSNSAGDQSARSCRPAQRPIGCETAFRTHRDRAPFEIKDEYDVQDFLHAILKLHFDDVRPEEHRGHLCPDCTPRFLGYRRWETVK